MKILNWISWITGIGAVIIVMLAFVALLFKVEFFGVRHVFNYFHVANSLLLIAILCAIYYCRCDCKKD